MTTTKDDLRFDQVSIGQSFELSVVSGEIPQLTAHRIHARNPDIGTSVEDIWTVGGVMSWPTSAAVLNIWSSSANDANTTTAIGTRTVRIEGLLAGFTATTEDVSLNGTATVTSSNSFIRINKAYSLNSGTYGGTIDPIHGTVTFSLGGTSTCNWNVWRNYRSNSWNCNI